MCKAEAPLHFKRKVWTTPMAPKHTKQVLSCCLTHVLHSWTLECLWASLCKGCDVRQLEEQLATVTHTHTHTRCRTPFGSHGALCPHYPALVSSRSQAQIKLEISAPVPLLKLRGHWDSCRHQDFCTHNRPLHLGANRLANLSSKAFCSSYADTLVRKCSSEALEAWLPLAAAVFLATVTVVGLGHTGFEQADWLTTR